MDNRSEARAFLVSRRARVTPLQAGISSSARRRVPGLRRSEVADLAGVSVEYYSRLERGNLRGASLPVLDGIAHALQLDDAEREHLLNLARVQNDGLAALPRRSSRRWVPRPSIQWMLDRITDAPAFISNGRHDLLATNQLGRALYIDLLRDPQRPANFARFQFLDSASRRLYPQWDKLADMTVANLRTEAGRDPSNKELHDLVGELSTRSEEFRTRWGAHDVRHHGNAVKVFHHPVVGELHLAFEGFDLVAEPGLSMGVYSAQPGSPTDERLQLLASWAATDDTHSRPVGPPANADERRSGST